MRNFIAEDGGFCVVHGGRRVCVLQLKFLALQQPKGPLNLLERKERPAFILYKVNGSIYVCFRWVKWSLLYSEGLNPDPCLIEQLQHRTVLYSCGDDAI